MLGFIVLGGVVVFGAIWPKLVTGIWLLKNEKLLHSVEEPRRISRSMKKRSAP